MREVLLRGLVQPFSPKFREMTAVILYALGHATTHSPRSVPILDVLDRLTKVDISFTDREKNVASAMIGQRNTELHTGQLGFDGFPVSVWLGDFYRIAKILVNSQKMGLEDYLGRDEADAAETMMTEKNASLKKTVINKINSHKQVFSALPKEEQDIKKKASDTKNLLEGRETKRIECPGCLSWALLSGELISVSPPKLIGEAIKQESRYLPTKFACFACGLNMHGYAELDAIDLGGQFTVTEELDPVEYHQIEVSDYVDVDEIIRQHAENGYMDE